MDEAASAARRRSLPTPANECLQCAPGVYRDLAWGQLAAAGDHLMGREPDVCIEEFEVSGAIEPPEQTELVDGEENIAISLVYEPAGGRISWMTTS